MRYIFTVLLLLLVALTLAGCSFSTDYAVVNESGEAIEVTYKIGGETPDPFDMTGNPATLPASQLSSREWQQLSPTQYVLDREKRTVTVSLMPSMALRINHGREWRENENPAEFTIKEIEVRAPHGQLILKGDRVYRSFVIVPKPFYSFGPPTVLTLTYK